MAAFALGGVAGRTTGVVAEEQPAAPEAPPLPWGWTPLDPLETGRRAYRFYKEKGGCGTGAYLSLLSMLKERVGYPWTTLPDHMLAHGAAGYGGHGTLCGSLGGSACIINLVAYGTGKDAVFRQIIDRLFWWYAEQKFPTNRFDDISPMPDQIKVLTKTPLCHTSVSSWTLAAGAEVTSQQKIERCAKVCGEVVYTVVSALNEHFEGRWTPPVWKPSEQIKHCVECHGPDTIEHDTDGMNQQQGHMECLLCHDDHTV
jgi:hypothetical protein